MEKMVLRPDADGYGSTDGTEWLMTDLDGGVGRYRQDKLGASKRVNAQWTLNPSQYQYWRSFYAVVGSRTFLCDLVSEDGSGPAEHECNIIPGSVTLPKQQGLMYVQQCQLEVKPLARDEELDAIVVMLFSELGTDAEATLLAIARFANVSLPDFSDQIGD
jgi:hypothetical protein